MVIPEGVNAFAMVITLGGGCYVEGSHACESKPFVSGTGLLL